MAGLDRLGTNLVDAVRPAAQAGAQVFYDEVRTRAPMSAKIHGYKGQPKAFKPGNLKAAVYQVFVKDSPLERPEYQISFNKTKAFYGRFVEFGAPARGLPARPFVRPSYDARKDDALEAVKVKFLSLARESINAP